MRALIGLLLVASLFVATSGCALIVVPGPNNEIRVNTIMDHAPSNGSSDLPPPVAKPVARFRSSEATGDQLSSVEPGAPIDYDDELELLNRRPLPRAAQDP